MVDSDLEQYPTSAVSNWIPFHAGSPLIDDDAS